MKPVPAQTAPWHICRDCSKLAVDGSPYCETHQVHNRASAQSRDRESSRRELGFKRFYDSPAWRRGARPRVLARDPFCAIGIICGGNAPSQDVDHIIRAEQYIAAHGGDPRRFYDLSNLRGACHACHAHKTALEGRGAWREDGIGGERGRGIGF